MKVVNLKKDVECTHFCGRKSSFKNEDKFGLDYSILGNPFQMIPWGHYTRAECLKIFKKYLNDEMKKNTKVWQALVDLPEDAVLGCFCKPYDCHCDIVKDFYDKYVLPEREFLEDGILSVDGEKPMNNNQKKAAAKLGKEVSDRHYKLAKESGLI